MILIRDEEELIAALEGPQRFLAEARRRFLELTGRSPQSSDDVNAVINMARYLVETTFDR